MKGIQYLQGRVATHCFATDLHAFLAPYFEDEWFLQI